MKLFNGNLMLNLVMIAILVISVMGAMWLILSHLSRVRYFLWEHFQIWFVY